MRRGKTQDELHAERELGQILTEMRRHANLTQTEVAHRAGTAQSTISEIEKSASLEVHTLRRIVRALDYDIKILIERRYEA